METNQKQEEQPLRLCDRIAGALKLAIEQEDLDVSESLMNALELAMTRNAGGADFAERRDFPPEMEAIMDHYEELRTKKNRSPKNR